MVRSIPFPCVDSCPPTGPCIQNALRTPLKTGNPRVDFYTMYKRGSTEYDTDYVERYDKDLNRTLIFICYSSSYLVNYLAHSCKPTCSLQSAPPSSSTSIRISNPILPNNPPPYSVPPSSISTNPPLPAGYHRLARSGRPPERDCRHDVPDVYEPPDLAVGSIHHDAAEVVAKPHLRNSGGSVAERCGDRQWKCDGLKKWPLPFSTESLLLVLQAVILLLACRSTSP